MSALILIVVFGIIFGYFATQNAGPITLYFGSYTLAQVPLYLVILGSLALGSLMVGLFYLVRVLSDRLTISEKEDELKKTKEEEVELTKEVHKLELENTKLKAELGEEDVDEDSL